MRLRTVAAMVAVVALVLGAAVLTTRAAETSAQAARTVTRRAAVSPPPPTASGWYVAASPPGSFRGMVGDVETRRVADEWAETARQRGYVGVRVDVPSPGSSGCYTGPQGPDGTSGWACGSSSGLRGYVVLIEGPLSPPVDPVAEDAWYFAMREEAQQRGRARGLPYDVLLLPFTFRSSRLPPRADNDAVRLVPSSTVADGWYVTLTPGSITTDEVISLGAAYTLADRASLAGYEDIRIAKWPQENRPCNPWGCEDNVPRAVYVVLLDGPYPTADAAHAVQRAALATVRPMVATPSVVPLRFSEKPRPRTSRQ